MFFSLFLTSRCLICDIYTRKRYFILKKNFQIVGCALKICKHINDFISLVDRFHIRPLYCCLPSSHRWFNKFDCSKLVFSVLIVLSYLGFWKKVISVPRFTGFTGFIYVCPLHIMYYIQHSHTLYKIQWKGNGKL